ncbi:MAG TPA: hypothetical protein VIA06_15870 [Candidatus Dormibacteraeota bacterium]|jgi:hypothetical protein|nr:hypothetical protein [Candidatus Dormibacteraeota bacterium]
MEVPEWRAGVARVTITPPVGIAMIGFAGRASSNDVQDDLTATALVVEGPGSGGAPGRAAIIACDLLWLEEPAVARVRAAVAALTDVAGDHVLIACSHTHYGPMVDAGSELAGPQVGPYVDNLVHLLAGAVAMAESRLTPCRFGFGEGEARIGINRRERLADGRMILGQNPDGPYDPRVALLRIDDAEGRPLALLLNHACHPVSLGGTCTHISADFPGHARRLIEAETGTTILFLQGSTADVNPLLMGWDWSHPTRLGTTLGEEAIRIYKGITPAPASGFVGMARAEVDLPPLLPPSVEEGEALVASLTAELERVREAGAPGPIWWAGGRLDRARHGLEALRGGPGVEPVPASLAALRIGQIALATSPGEIFTRLGGAVVDGSPFAHTMFAGYTDGSIGYVPTRDAYPEGGYEVTHACRVAPEAGELVVSTAGRLLGDLHNHLVDG